MAHVLMWVRVRLGIEVRLGVEVRIRVRIRIRIRVRNSSASKIVIDKTLLLVHFGIARFDRTQVIATTIQ
jgi:hypothetical protein